MGKLIRLSNETLSDWKNRYQEVNNDDNPRILDYIIAGFSVIYYRTRIYYSTQESDELVNWFTNLESSKYMHSSLFCLIIFESMTDSSLFKLRFIDIIDFSR